MPSLPSSLFTSCISEPVFVSSLLDPSDRKVYFFFSEVGKEFSFTDELKITRVAQVCKVTVNAEKSLWLQNVITCKSVNLTVCSHCAGFTGRRWRTENSAKEVDVLCQSPPALSVSQTASLQCSPGRVHSAATRGRRRCRHSVLRRLHLSVVGRLWPNLNLVNLMQVCKNLSTKLPKADHHTWRCFRAGYVAASGFPDFILFFCPTLSWGHSLIWLCHSCV